MSGEIVEVDMPFQARLGMHFGMPSTLTELLALTWVSEQPVREDRRVQDLIDRALVVEELAIADLVASESLPEPTPSAT